METGRAESDAEPRPVWVIVNTMNNIYSERLVCIDRPRTVCAPHLFLLRIHFPALMKETGAGENLMRRVETFLNQTFCSFESVTSFLLFSSLATHPLFLSIVACVLVSGVRSLVDGIRVNQQCEAGEDIRLAYCFPFIRQEERDFKCVCACLCVREQVIKRGLAEKNPWEQNSEHVFEVLMSLIMLPLWWELAMWACMCASGIEQASCFQSFDRAYPCVSFL